MRTAVVVVAAAAAAVGGGGGGGVGSSAFGWRISCIFFYLGWCSLRRCVCLLHRHQCGRRRELNISGTICCKNLKAESLARGTRRRRLAKLLKTKKGGPFVIQNLTFGGESGGVVVVADWCCSFWGATLVAANTLPLLEASRDSIHASITIIWMLDDDGGGDVAGNIIGRRNSWYTY